MNITLDNKLNTLNVDELRQVIQWTLNDLQAWSNNDRVKNDIGNHCAMLHEAVSYQISKAVDKKNN
jgi:hypothetical protein|tara:strand:+ start:1380 stop:1577 length:198 start_codon:yes stop_codon:yes gene_type:complete